jgi:hypothetical protein
VRGRNDADPVIPQRAQRNIPGTGIAAAQRRDRFGNNATKRLPSPASVPEELPRGGGWDPNKESVFVAGCIVVHFPHPTRKAWPIRVLSLVREQNRHTRGRRQARKSRTRTVSLVLASRLSYRAARPGGANLSHATFARPQRPSPERDRWRWPNWRLGKSSRGASQSSKRIEPSAPPSTTTTNNTAVAASSHLEGSRDSFRTAEGWASSSDANVSERSATGALGGATA